MNEQSPFSLRHGTRLRREVRWTGGNFGQRLQTTGPTAGGLLAALAAGVADSDAGTPPSALPWHLRIDADDGAERWARLMR